MTVQEFHEIRKPFYIDDNTLLVKFAPGKFLNASHAEWFTEYSIPWYNMIRGYLMETENHQEDYIMLYQNNFNIPNITVQVVSYLFSHFPYVKWIGLGCYKGEPGEIWRPQMQVYNE